MAEKFRLIPEGPDSGHINMAKDQTLLDFFLNGDTPGALRFYQWEKPTLSFGYFQKVNKEVDWSLVSEKGFDAARRPTGGRTVLHMDEVTFSLVFDTKGEGLWQIFKKVHQAVGRGLQLLGIPAVLIPAGSCSADVDSEYSLPRHSSACFASPSRYELGINGRKVAGTAQKLVKNAVLVHGSIPIGSNFRHLFDVLQFPSEEARTAAYEKARLKMTSILESTGRVFTVGQLQQAITEGFKREWQIDFTDSAFSPQEMQHVLDISERFILK